MSCPERSTSPTPSAIPEYVATISGDGQVALRRNGTGVRLELRAPVQNPKPGGRSGMIVHGSLDISARRAVEVLMALSSLLDRVDREGLPDAA
jgi:hypothetical protein